MRPATPTLEAVYYGSPVPRGKAQLTALALVFDRLHFPNVFLPFEGVDLDALEKETRRIEAYKFTDHHTLVLLGLLRAIPHVKDLREFCTFTGDFNSICGTKSDSQAQVIVSALEEKMFGPTPPGFIPDRRPSSHKGIPGLKIEQSLTYADTLFYPANAMIYAGKLGLPLVNDSGLPVPALGSQSPKNNAQLLSTILALECVALALPVMPSLTPAQIVQVRSELEGALLPFRAGLLRLAGKLNEQISQNAIHEDIVKQAQFLVATEIQPALLELSNGLEKSTKSLTTRAFEVVKHVPTLAASAMTMDWSLAIAHALAAVGGILTEQQQDNPKAVAARSPVYYLLRLQQVAGKRR